MTLETCLLERHEIPSRLDDLARLRIEVFRAYPYLYDGDIDYEKRYLKTYLASKNAVIFGAFEGRRLVGAATASPLDDHFEEFGRPFKEAGLDSDDYFYFGESVLLPEYRGQGIGVRFFELREAAAQHQGYPACVFSSVIRPKDHPAKPDDHVPLDQFWRNRGYERIKGLVTEFSWADIGDSSETAKPMEYWQKFL